MANTVRILAADSYRMIDALRDYADILDAEGEGGEGFTPTSFNRAAADRMDSATPVNGLVEVERFDIDAAHSAVLGIMCRRYEAAERARDDLARLTVEAKRYEDFLPAFRI